MQNDAISDTTFSKFQCRPTIRSRNYQYYRNCRTATTHSLLQGNSLHIPHNPKNPIPISRKRFHFVDRLPNCTVGKQQASVDCLSPKKQICTSRQRTASKIPSNVNAAPMSYLSSLNNPTRLNRLPDFFNSHSQLVVFAYICNSRNTHK